MTESFVVNDKRTFNKDGELNPEATGASETPSSSTIADSASAQEPMGNSFADAALGPMLPANFTGLLLGLATSAFINLGEQVEENGQQPQVDLAGAKHAIDLLSVLQVKTAGNLEPEEESLLTTLLYDLRMKFIQASKA